jgi:hypothetical protein
MCHTYPGTGTTKGLQTFVCRPSKILPFGFELSIGANFEFKRSFKCMASRSNVLRIFNTCYGMSKTGSSCASTVFYLIEKFSNRNRKTYMINT